MVLPIAPTPVLKGADAEKFLRTIRQDLQNPAELTPTPKLKQASKLIRKYAKEQARRS